MKYPIVKDYKTMQAAKARDARNAALDYKADLAIFAARRKAIKVDKDAKAARIVRARQAADIVRLTSVRGVVLKERLTFNGRLKSVVPKNTWMIFDQASHVHSVNTLKKSVRTGGWMTMQSRLSIQES